MGRMGRPPVAGTSRSDTVCVRFANTELEAVDKSRGDLNRSDFIRQAVKDATRQGQR